MWPLKPKPKPDTELTEQINVDLMLSQCSELHTLCQHLNLTIGEANLLFSLVYNVHRCMTKSNTTTLTFDNTKQTLIECKPDKPLTLKIPHDGRC